MKRTISVSRSWSSSIRPSVWEYERRWDWRRFRWVTTGRSIGWLDEKPF